jgi:hypothetical protein
MDFVCHDEARRNLKSAEQNIINNQLEAALGEIAIAFKQVLNDYEERKQGRFGRSPFFFGADLTFHNSFFMGLNQNHELREMSGFVDKVQESIKSMQTAIKLLALGIDYRRYARYQLYVPIVHHMASGTFRTQEKRGAHKITASKEDVQYCIDFVIETAIHLRDFDYDHPFGEQDERNGFSFPTPP